MRNGWWILCSGCILIALSGCRRESALNDYLPGDTSYETSPGSNPKITDYDWWRPDVGLSWQWHLSDLPIDDSVDAIVFDIDLFENTADQVAQLHGQGRSVICYISVGSYEDWRPDAGLFPASVLGKKYSGWPGERWLDIRQIDIIGPIMLDRLDECISKGFDAVEPDNMDSFSNRTGFPITYEDQLKYNLWLAREAHARGLSIGLKNTPEMAVELEPFYDWAITEDCFSEGWCEEMIPFIRYGKPVFAAEYTDTGVTLDEICPQAELLGISLIYKNRELDGWTTYCP
jgi:endo-alpha-1,4-polygalactosaminidase (GH114 family)